MEINNKIKCFHNATIRENYYQHFDIRFIEVGFVYAYTHTHTHTHTRTCSYTYNYVSYFRLDYAMYVSINK